MAVQRELGDLGVRLEHVRVGHRADRYRNQVASTFAPDSDELAGAPAAGNRQQRLLKSHPLLDGIQADAVGATLERDIEDRELGGGRRQSVRPPGAKLLT